jgi:putative oxygen-independent coproporphyrinogen III oxidase
VPPSPTTASVYVHFPWCLAKCPYCDFVSYAAPRETIDHDGYADAVVRELEARLPLFRRSIGDARVGSVFFGGGTPSLWSPAALGRVLGHVKRALADRIDEASLEVTVECNPTSLDEPHARALVDVGVTRLSIGTQSLAKDQLNFLGRLHDPDGALASIDAAIRAKVPRVSTDLIFGLPNQTPEDARAQAATLADRGLGHLSCYQLTIEPGTRFGELAKRGRLPLADDGRVADAFLAIDEELSGRGLRHYEISNYARPGEEARHNLAYWRGAEYLGLGCGAYGAFARVRYRNAIDPARYCEATLRGAVRSDVVGEGDGLSMSSEALDGETLLRERIMLGLRVAEGIDVDANAAELGVEAWPADRLRALARLEASGRVERDGSRLVIPARAWLFADDTAARLF